jgi:Protein of unknown function (DUF2442)
MIRVSTVVADSDYQLTLIFTNQERRRFDMRPYLELPVFQPLKNPGFFALASVDYGTVVWPGEIDMAPETLYELSVTQDPVSVSAPSNLRHHET